MRIYIRIDNGKILELEVDPRNTLASVKVAIEDYEGIPVKHQRLIFAGKEFEDEKSISDTNVGPDTSFHLIVRESN
jgi:hypothetical protein